ncbi:hypothetical protein [Nocardia transvalensis]|uniref:hypothetical protein n=1 Tax=Nocardia transvalensis TaxID=37333 RepID=UPI001892E2B6|nr:hypothetical protein [Nocardia transvalensis]MBF6333221.1 hypothetical protein [Nocardia transvalensis]
MTPLPLEASPREQQIAMALLAHAARGDHEAIATLFAVLAAPGSVVDPLYIACVIVDECGCVVPVFAEPFSTEDTFSIIRMILDECQWATRHCSDAVAARFTAQALVFAAMDTADGGR